MFYLLLKTKTVFFIGFSIGGILALLLMLAEDFISDEFVCNLRVVDEEDNKFQRYIASETKIKDSVIQEIRKLSYQKWLRLQNVKISKSNMDELIYGKESGPEIKNKQILESNWLKSKIHVTCVIFVDKIKLAESIRDTWAPRCNNVYYFGAEKEDKEIPVINFGIKLTSSWQFLCESISYIWRKSSNGTHDTNERIEWLIFVKDDTMVIPENLRRLLAPMDFQKGYYLGHPVVLWGQAYNVAQAGYVLSKGSFVKIAENFNTREKCAAGGKYWKKEDYYLGKHLGAAGIHPLDTRDKDLSGIFHGYSLQILLWGVAKAGRYWTHALYPIGDNCCSSNSVTFSAGEPDKMHNLYYMLYRLNIYQDDGVFGNQPSATELPDREMWKTILKEEFNITNLNEISSQRYYDIWRERYSEPEQFIMNNYKNMPEVLSSLLTAYEAEKKLDKTNTSLT